ncbi:hypothetical protein J7T55_010663 [Diaporthe amygdali]|uniref:uncharacterized protein n=1 Tax=Phomopsis amygdali TaxID=1214568 RepID=UPI0022FEE52C|nr:uncharacterized protein J7T55_010663 [Diaporthe amygdali]KAJ0114274.1 hypothetical protein J7T55_010663 [Diaporthe amygdali]
MITVDAYIVDLFSPGHLGGCSVHQRAQKKSVWTWPKTGLDDIEYPYRRGFSRLRVGVDQQRCGAERANIESLLGRNLDMYSTSINFPDTTASPDSDCAVLDPETWDDKVTISSPRQRSGISTKPCHPWHKGPSEVGALVDTNFGGSDEILRVEGSPSAMTRLRSGLAGLPNRATAMSTGSASYCNTFEQSFPKEEPWKASFPIPLTPDAREIGQGPIFPVVEAWDHEDLSLSTPSNAAICCHMRPHRNDSHRGASQKRQGAPKGCSAGKKASRKEE